MGEDHKSSDKKTRSFPIQAIFSHIRKWSYYLSLLLFYTSLYGFIYGISLMYDIADFIEVFHGTSLLISLVIIGIFVFFLGKKQETIFLVFRSNCIVFTFVYSFFLLLAIVRGNYPTTLFIINSILPIITLLGVLVLDPFFPMRRKQVYLYPFFLFYTFLVVVFYASYLFSDVPLRSVFLSVASFLMIVYTFVFPCVPRLAHFGVVSRTVGVFASYFTTFAVVFSLAINESLPPFYSTLLVVSATYHYAVHRLLKSYASYTILLSTLVFLYIKIFVLWGAPSFASYFIFIFFLPYAFVGISYFIAIKTPKELYVMHFMGICFSVLAILYYLIQGGFS